MTRTARPRQPELDHDPIRALEPILASAVRFLEASPRGVSRADLLAALHLQDRAWDHLREALDACAEVVTIGRGPGQRHLHISHLASAPLAQIQQRMPAGRTAQLDQARATLREAIRSQGEIDSGDAQEATGLAQDAVRRLLLEMVDEGLVQRRGQKRNTRYRWVG